MATLTGILGITAPAAGQDEATEAQPAPPPEPLITIETGFQHIFESDLDGGGEVDITRVPLAIEAEIRLSDQLDLVTGINYELSMYDFSGISALGPDPWDDIHTLTLLARLQWSLNDRTRLWGAPFVTWSWESGADRDEDAVAGGGALGVTHIFNEKLVLGGGLGVTARVEEDPLVYPIIIVNWKIADDLTLTSRAGPRGTAAAGLELVYDLGHGWETGVGGRFEYRRFRLDDDGPVPGGVGEEQSVPFWGRLSYRFNENFDLSLFAGVVVGGRFKLDDSGGRRVAEDDYGPTPTIALIGSLQF